MTSGGKVTRNPELDRAAAAMASIAAGVADAAVLTAH